MLNNFRNFHSLFWSHGTRWLLFRAGYALRKRTGYIRRQMPVYRWKDRPLATWLEEDIPSSPETYAEWRKVHSPKYFFDSFDFPVNPPWDPESAVEEAERILSGELKYFFHTYYQVGFPPGWHTDPVTGIKIDSRKHWSEISDDPGMDIKFIWEPSRFAMVYSLVRAYASTRDERFAEAFWYLIRSWAESNPPNTGPNWMDGQEAALRLMAWTFGFHAFRNSPHTTPDRVSQFVVMAAAHAERIYRNLDYAISTHSNHTISEAFGLWLAGLLFPELEKSKKYLSLGRKILEQEAATQLFPDGTYSMYSLNYHRFVLHLYLCMIRLAELNQSQISSLVLDRVSTSIDYLSQLIDPQTGQMPFYGSNDGALVLPLNNCDFTDFRPLLQLGSYAAKKKFLFDPGPWDEDVFWLYGEMSLKDRGARTKGNDEVGFSDGGIYILHGSNSKAILRCTDHRARPSHADQLHVDLWIRGRNIACDAGTYLYSGEGIWRNGLAHTHVHNTVTVDRLDQMQMLSRFTWTDWSHGKVLRHEEDLWQGEHDGYRRLPDPVNHRRTVISFSEDRWLIVDHLTASRSHHYSLHWLLTDSPYGVEELSPGFRLQLNQTDSKLSDSIVLQTGLLAGKGNFSIIRADPHNTRGWRSRYYGEKEPALSALLEADQPNACFWSFFGKEADKIQLIHGQLNISSEDWSTTLDLTQLKK